MPPRSVDGPHSSDIEDPVDDLIFRFEGVVGGSSIVGVVKVIVAGWLSLPALSIAVTLTLYDVFGCTLSQHMVKVGLIEG